MKYLYLAFIALVLFSCTKEKQRDLSKLEETIYVRNNGADMPVYMRGNMLSKVVILIVHGGPGDGGYSYRNGLWPEKMEEKYAMAYWDQRGQAMSHGHYNKEDVTVAQMADDMKAVIEVLKAKYGSDVSVFALGHSWGGTLSAKFLITGNNQDLLNGWIETDGAHDIPKVAKESLKLFIAIAKEQISIEKDTKYWKGILEWASGYNQENITTEQWGEINSKGFELEGWMFLNGYLQKPEKGGLQSSFSSGPTNFLTKTMSEIIVQNLLGDEFYDAAYTDELHKITIPVLILWGKYDFIVPPALGMDTYNKISSTVKKMVIFEKSAHSPMAYEWKKFADEVILFVEENK